MRSLYSRLLLVLMLNVSSFACHATDQLTAYESVNNSTDLLLKKLVEVKPLYESDQERFFREVESTLEPYIDFDGFAKRVMAKHYRKANEAQQETFKQQFRESLIKTYSTALLEFDNQRVVVLEPQGEQKRPDRATVMLEVYGKSGAIYPVQYQLGLIEGSWLLRNVIINGINVGLQFRSQFNAYMQKHRGDVDKVIENWSVDVKSS